MRKFKRIVHVHEHDYVHVNAAVVVNVNVDVDVTGLDLVCGRRLRWAIRGVFEIRSKNDSFSLELPDLAGQLFVDLPDLARHLVNPAAQSSQIILRRGESVHPFGSQVPF